MDFTYGLSVYGAVDSDLTVIQNFLDRCFKGKYVSKRMDIRELLVKADKKLFKVRSVDPDCPLSNIIPKKKETKYQLRNKTAHRPEIKTDRFKNAFLNSFFFLDIIFNLSIICVLYVYVFLDFPFYLGRNKD